MTLINDPASRPAPMWATVRLLASEGRPVGYERAKALLTPTTVVGSDHKMFEWAISTLESLGLVSQSDERRLSLTGPAKTLDGKDYGAFIAIVRSAALAPELNTGIGDDDSQTGPRDLCRALCWFLTLDPTRGALSPSTYPNLQKGALKPAVGPAIVNNNRWAYFGDWAPALGFGAEALPTGGDAGHLVPDCTPAIRQTVQSRWKSGETVNAVDFLRGLREALPVIPGGAYSTAVGLASPGETVAGPALSFALLRAVDEGWLKLERNADARRFLSIHNPEQPTSPLSYSSITIVEGLND